MSLPGTLDLLGPRWGIYRGDTWGPKRFQLSRVVRDANATSGSNVLNSASAAFSSADIGVRVVPLMPDGTADPAFGTFTISSVNSGTQVVLSSNLPAALTNRLLMIMRQDITGLSWSAQVKATLDQTASPVASFTINVVDSTLGIIELKMTSTASAAIAVPGSTYRWDLQSVDGSSNVKTWLRGLVEVDADVTH